MGDEERGGKRRGGLDLGVGGGAGGGEWNWERL